MEVQAPYPRNYFDALCEALRFVDEARADEGRTKADVLDSVENRLSFLLTKLLAAPLTTSYCVFRHDDPPQACGPVGGD
jgi:hypothetical protein